MRKLIVFNSVSLDGFFTSAKGDMSWAHAGSDDPEYDRFIAGNAKGGGVLVFGRVTYQMMQSYWPTPAAARDNPTVAAQMNALPKIVFSRKLQRADWNNTQLLHGDPVAAIRRIKRKRGPTLVLMGSGTIITQLAQAGVIDEYQMIVTPVVLGRGRTMFETVKRQLGLELKKSRTFKNGKVFAVYEPSA